ncbi:MAG: hypothetical protein PHD60_09385 [Clostridia bacterium]|nr:hypothetical protein [Clostridia bacterium]
MDSRKAWQIFFILGFCLCLNLLFPGFAQAIDENEGVIGGRDYNGVIDEVTIHDAVVSQEDVAANYISALGVDGITVEDTFEKSLIKSVYDATIPCKLGFNLINGVDSVEIDVKIPDMLRVSDVGAVFKDGVEQCAVTYEGNKFYINNHLAPGSYEITYDVKYNTIYSIVVAAINGIAVKVEPFTVVFVEYPGLL